MAKVTAVGHSEYNWADTKYFFSGPVLWMWADEEAAQIKKEHVNIKLCRKDQGTVKSTIL